ncbi:MAG: hypothetical protein DWQ56_03380 [Microcystis aeruginosa DA14]|uniref:Uncharacterized protein n=1 Tax=Microcystis aeruginosa DA14 TaxID=1987506 RepID=A0A3E0MLP3_MICAE|nr:MAG: hypothetical protein DWQ56_03380 [Microcystis aeruginosa DA14]
MEEQGAGSSRFCVISLTYIMIDRSLCPLCLCGSFHPLALEKCILEYILPTKAGRAGSSEKQFITWQSIILLKTDLVST